MQLSGEFVKLSNKKNMKINCLYYSKSQYKVISQNIEYIFCNVALYCGNSDFIIRTSVCMSIHAHKVCSTKLKQCVPTKYITLTFQYTS